MMSESEDFVTELVMLLGTSALRIAELQQEVAILRTHIAALRPDGPLRTIMEALLSAKDWRDVGRDYPGAEKHSAEFHKGFECAHEWFLERLQEAQIDLDALDYDVFETWVVAENPAHSALSAALTELRQRMQERLAHKEGDG